MARGILDEINRMDHDDSPWTGLDDGRGKAHEEFDREGRADFEHLLSWADVSDRRRAVLGVIFGDRPDTLIQARWPDESAFWAALTLADPEARIIRASGIDGPAYRPTGRRSARDFERLRIEVADWSAIRPLLTFNDCVPEAFDYGPLTAVVAGILSQARARSAHQRAVLDELAGGIEVGLDSLLDRALAVDPEATARIRLAYRSAFEDDPLCWAAALATWLGDSGSGILVAWRELRRFLDDDGWTTSRLFEVPRGHPIPFPDDLDLGPNRAALRAFYDRSADLTKPEIIALDAAWTEHPWQSGAYDGVADASAGRPSAYAVRDDSERWACHSRRAWRSRTPQERSRCRT